ncbi:MAG: sigma-70 family RNA polymerase sigma factor [Planctomycetes bacterium]|nr:sigma-70 family RNA polymerase sigma factor [Planctomycetota bacterium]
MPATVRRAAAELDGDAEIARLLPEPDGSGLRRLLAVHGGRVYARLTKGFAAGLGAHEVEEAMQTATCRAWLRADHYDPRRGSLRAWFYVVAANACRELLRARKRRERETRVADIDQVPEPDVVIPRVPPAYLDVLRECVSELPPLQRAIIEADLRAGDVANAAELAAQFATTKNSIYVSRCEARKTLREALARRGCGPVGPEDEA